MRQNGLRIGDLDAVTLAVLDTWARGQAKLELLDRYFAEHGTFLDEATGEPHAATKFYVSLLNATRRSAVELGRRLAALGLDERDARSSSLPRVRKWWEDPEPDEEDEP